MPTKNVIIAGAVILIVSAGSFYGGIIYQKKKLSSPREFRGGNLGQRQGGGMVTKGSRGGENGQFMGGEIMSRDDKSITIKTPDGGSKIIFFSDTTTMGKAVEGTVADLEIGQPVMINGTSNSDGTINARSIQIRTTQ